SYTVAGDDKSAEAEELKRRADSMDKEAAVHAGLLKGFESRYVTVWDGEALLKYWEIDGKPDDTTIDDPGKSATFTFDPRCLGLRAFLWARSTVENCLSYKEAKSVSLVGKELVEEVPAWHVQVKSKHDESLDFWIDVAHPDHVVK